VRYALLTPGQTRRRARGVVSLAFLKYMIATITIEMVAVRIVG
jgi:hypothetical protein